MAYLLVFIAYKPLINSANPNIALAILKQPVGHIIAPHGKQWLQCCAVVHIHFAGIAIKHQPVARKAIKKTGFSKTDRIYTIAQRCSAKLAVYIANVFMGAIIKQYAVVYGRYRIAVNIAIGKGNTIHRPAVF